MKGPLDDGWLHEEIQPPSSSGCGILGRGVQGYDVTTSRFQQSYTINTPVHSFLSGPLVSPTREPLGISSRILLFCRFVRLTYKILGCCRRINLQSPGWHPTASPRHYFLPCKISPPNHLLCWKNAGPVCGFSNLHAFGMVVMTYIFGPGLHRKSQLLRWL